MVSLQVEIYKVRRGTGLQLLIPSYVATKHMIETSNLCLAMHPVSAL